MSTRAMSTIIMIKVKRMRRFIVFILALVSLSAAGAVYSPATVPSPKDAGQAYYVSNPDSILCQDDVDYLNACCRLLDDTVQVEMAVVVLESIGEYEPFDFGYELFQRWGIGKAGKNTGVLITFALASRQVYMNTGSGIEGVLPDATCKKIIQEDMIPLFKLGDYGGGLCAAATHVYRICTNGEAPEELLNMTSATNRGKFAAASGSAKSEDDVSLMEWGIFTVFVFLIVLPFLLIVLVQRKTQSTEDELDQRMSCLGKLGCACIFFPFLIPSVIWFALRSRRLRCPQCGKQRYKIIHTETAPLKNGSKRKTETWLCSACGYKHLHTKTIKATSYSGYSGSSYSGSSYSDSSYSSSSSDSGGSWGGGSTSGGGAGGSW